VLARLADDSNTGDRVEIFVRPEALRIGGDNGSGSLSGKVDSLLFNGAASRILVRLDTGQLVEVADGDQASEVSAHDAITVSWQPDRSRIFVRRPGA
ncbi:MAG: TOBE domain-containing protein, partial [Jannaschia helgolandensis]